MLSLLLAATMAQAAGLQMNCTITEGGKESKVTKVQHMFTDDPHGAITHFETAYTNGFVSNQKGYAVINYVVKDTKQVISFYGDALHARATGGTFYIDGSLTSYVETECLVSIVK